jgi:hypothetical protein
MARRRSRRNGHRSFDRCDRYGRNDTVRCEEVYDLASGTLRRSLQWADHGYKCTVQAVLLVLFFAASHATSICDACRRLLRAPGDQAVRDALAVWLPEVPELERRLNLALRERLPKAGKGLLRKARPAALDFTEVCYYGRCHRKRRELRRGKRKAGTDQFHCYATLSVIRRGERFTVAATYVWADDSKAEVVRRLLERAREAGLKLRYLLLDRGFYGLDVVKLLQSKHVPFLMPVVHRGRKPKPGRRCKSRQLKGTRRFLSWKRSGFSEHVMDNRKQRARVGIAVACRPRKPKKPSRQARPRGRRNRKKAPLVFAFWGFRPHSPAWARQTYRRRFGVETGYRQMNQGRARTCGRDPRLRLLLVGIALVLRNLWVWLHYRVLGRVRGRGLELRLALLRLRTMLLMLQRCAEATFGCTEAAGPIPAAALALPQGSGP